jgi:hypothetical protein
LKEGQTGRTIRKDGQKKVRKDEKKDRYKKVSMD